MSDETLARLEKWLRGGWRKYLVEGFNNPSAKPAGCIYRTVLDEYDGCGTNLTEATGETREIAINAALDKADAETKP